MGSEGWRRFAEPVLEFGLIRRVAVTQVRRRRDRRPRLVERLHTSQDVDHRFRGQPRYSGAADVLNRPDQPSRQRSTKQRVFELAKLGQSTSIALDDKSLKESKHVLEFVVTQDKP